MPHKASHILTGGEEAEDVLPPERILAAILRQNNTFEEFTEAEDKSDSTPFIKDFDLEQATTWHQSSQKLKEALAKENVPQGEFYARVRDAYHELQGRNL